MILYKYVVHLLQYHCKIILKKVITVYLYNTSFQLTKQKFPSIKTLLITIVLSLFFSAAITFISPRLPSSIIDVSTLAFAIEPYQHLPSLFGLLFACLSDYTFIKTGKHQITFNAKRVYVLGFIRQPRSPLQLREQFIDPLQSTL